MTTPLRMIGLTRKSKGEDEGTHADQKAIISRRAEAEGFDLIRVEKEHQVSGAKSWKEREFGQAIEDVKAGRADGVIVAYEDRVTRERMLAAAEIWTALEDAGAVFVACDGVDSRAEGSELLYAIKAAIAREQWRMYQKRSNDGRRRAVMVEGVHGGDDAPFGYDFTKRADGSRNVSGEVKHGRLAPNADGPKIEPAFVALDNGGSWRDLTDILGFRAAASILRNRVYLGEAKSGEYVKPGAHPALVDGALFDRVQRKLDDRARDRREMRPVSTPRIVDELSGAMRCGECGHSMTPDHSYKGGTEYRCKYQGLNSQALHPNGRPSVTKTALLPVALELAKGWHRVHSPLYMLEREMDEAMLPALAAAEDEAERVLGEVEANRAVWDAVTYGNARADAVRRIEAARDARQEAEAAQGWLGIDAERVEERLAEGDPATVNDFLRDTIRVMVYPSPYGKRRKCPVEERIKVQYLSAGRGLDPAVVYAPPVEGGPVAPRPEDYIESEAVPDQFPEAGVMDDAEAARRLAEFTDPHPVQVPDRW
jgi:DNA invertase Pin-like site-specific DNA recombinase